MNRYIFGLLGQSSSAAENSSSSSFHNSDVEQNELLSPDTIVGLSMARSNNLASLGLHGFSSPTRSSGDLSARLCVRRRFTLRRNDWNLFT